MRALPEAWALGDRELNFEEIYTAHRERILRYLSRLVGEREAEDLTQETFLKAGSKLEGFRGESHVLTWLYRIATNAAVDKLRSPSGRELIQIQPSAEPAGEPLPHAHAPSAPTVERQAIREEMNACIRDVIDRLPERYRTIIVLSNLEGLKDGEIAEVLVQSTSAVKIRLHRAREQLKKELASTCVFYRDEDNELACDLKSLSGDTPDS